MIISRTPLRVSFAGGGSDLRAYYQSNYGAVVSTAIDKFMHVAVNRTFDHHIRVIYSKIEYVEKFEDIEHDLAREALKLVGITDTGIDIAYMGDMLPAHAGSGLGASSSLTVGILNALHAYKGEHVSAKILAEEACRIEIEILGRPIGKQDQYAAAYGGFNYMRFNKDESVSVEPIICSMQMKDALAKNLILFYTGLNTQSDNILTEQKGKILDNLPVLNRMVGLSEELRKAMTNNDLTGFGGILHEGWICKQKLATNITNSTFDDYYQKARKAGAIGGKLLGAGGGGFLLVLVFDGYYRVTGVPNASEEAVLPAVSEGKELGALQIEPNQCFTSPPPRYTEASLVRKLEAEGIGRPSTYAQIIQVIQNRKYVEKNQNRFYATDLGKVVTDKLMEGFPEIMQVGYTKDMEQQLDDIEDKHADWVEMLRRFYDPFAQSLESAYEVMAHAKAETQPASHTCPQCGGQTVYRFGKNGRFLSCARYPKCKFAAPVDRIGNPVAPEQTDIACPKCESPMLLRRGRFGLFLSCIRYPECDGIVNLDKKGLIAAPKIPPLLTDLSCSKCNSAMNLRRGARGPWLSCSKFPKCRGRIGWSTLEENSRKALETALQAHEKANPQAVVHNLHGTAVSEGYKPQPLNAGAESVHAGETAEA